MKKILSGLMVLTLLVLFATTYYCSRKTEEVFRAQVKQLNTAYPGLLRVELLDYQAGLLVSEVRTRLTFGGKTTLILHHQIRHFPWGVRIITRPEDGSPLAAELAEPVQLQTDVNLNGTAGFHLELPKLEITEQTGRVQLQGLRFDSTLESNQSGELTFQLENLQVEQPGKATTLLSALQLTSQFNEQQGLLLGSGDLKIGRLAISVAKQPGFELNRFHYQASSRLKKGQLSTTLKLTMGDLTLAGETFTDGQLRLTLSGISAAAVREIQKNSQLLQAELRNQQVDPLVRQLQLLGLYRQLFKAGLSLSLEQLAVHAGDGVMQGRGTVTLQETAGAGPPTLDQLTGQFRFDIDRSVFIAGVRLVDNLQQRGRPRNPAVTAELAEQLAGGLVQKGLLVRRKDGGYRFDLAIDRGQGILNGTPFKR